MSYRNPDKNEMLNKKKEETQEKRRERRREIMMRTNERLMKARMERMQEEDNERIRKELEPTIEKWSEFLEEALKIWVTGQKPNYKVINETWGDMDDFNSVRHNIADAIAVYERTLTEEQQKYLKLRTIRERLTKLNEIINEALEMERQEKEKERLIHEQQTIIQKLSVFPDNVLSVWNSIENPNDVNSKKVEEFIRWTKEAGFDGALHEFAGAIAVYESEPTKGQQLCSHQWDELKGKLETIKELVFKAREIESEKKRQEEKRKREDEERKAKERLINEQQAIIQEWTIFADNVLKTWNAIENPNDLKNPSVEHFIRWVNGVAFDDELHKFARVITTYENNPTPGQQLCSGQWDELKKKLETIKGIIVKVKILVEEKKKREKEEKRRQEERRKEEEKRRQEEKRKIREEEIHQMLEVDNEKRKGELNRRRKERRERLLNQNRKLINVEKYSEIGEGAFKPSEEFFEELCNGRIDQDGTCLKLYMSNGQSIMINLNTVPPGERWGIILKFLNNEELTSVDWNEIRYMEDAEYANLIWFYNKNMNDIIGAEFVKLESEITRARLGGGNFIPLVINPKYKWMKELWEQFQITESIFDEGVDKKRIKEIRREPCLYYSIKMNGSIINVSIIEKVISRKYGGIGPSPNAVTKILKNEMGLSFTYNSCKIISETKMIKSSQTYTRKERGDIHLNLIKYNLDQHYITGNVYKWDEAMWDKIDQWDEWEGFYTSCKGRLVNGSFMIVEGIKRGILQPMLPIERNEYLNNWDTTLNDRISRENIVIHSKKLEEIEKGEEKTKLFDVVYFADTEAIVTGEYHKVYCICWKKLIKESGEISEGYSYGMNCLDDFLNELKLQEGKKVVYFHNLKYDMSFFLNRVYLVSRIVKGNKIYQMKVCFDKNIAQRIKKGKGYAGKINDVITFRDSYGLISLPIRSFSSAFGQGDDGEKEVFPYTYMTEETLEEGIIDNCWKNEKPCWDEKKITQFKSNLEKKGWTHNGRWNTKAYTLYYCKRDVDILMRGFLKFEEQVNREFGIDPLGTLTISSLAHKYFMKKVYLNEDMRLVHGPLSDFIRKSCFGGRCMSNKNELYDIKGDIVDYDACSLYPSAMHRLYIPTGDIYIMDKPVSYYLIHLMDEGQTEPTEEKFISHFICEVNINKIRNHLDFPLTCKRGVTNEYMDFEPTSVDKDCVCWSGVYTSIQLEDLIKYQGIEFSDVKNEKDNYPATGIYWIGKKSKLLSETIQHVYKRRAEMKANKDPTQTVYKLLMNSAYGKTIQKDILFKERYFTNEDDAIKCVKQNYQTALTITKMNEHCFILKMKKDAIEMAAENWGLTYLGTMILAMSKRIMNEVFYAAQEAKVSIYYQDTDSIHLLKSDLDKLESKFKELYGREIRGNDMGNFHVDFDPINGDSDVCSKRCIILGKKCYLDVLENSKGEQEYHVRMKGISKNAIAGVAEQHGGYVQLYEYLFNSPLHYIKFDLAKYGNCFAFDGIHPPKSLDEFSRSLHFEGKRNVLDLNKLNE